MTTARGEQPAPTPPVAVLRFPHVHHDDDYAVTTPEGAPLAFVHVDTIDVVMTTPDGRPWGNLAARGLIEWNLYAPEDHEDLHPVATCSAGGAPTTVRVGDGPELVLAEAQGRSWVLQQPGGGRVLTARAVNRWPTRAPDEYEVGVHDARFPLPAVVLVVHARRRLFHRYQAT